jgi:phosphate transport system substrate-binding protein
MTCKFSSCTNRSPFIVFTVAIFTIGMAFGLNPTVFAENRHIHTEKQKQILKDNETELHVAGGSTLQPIIKTIIDKYQKHAGITLNVRGGGSGFGIASVRDGTIDVGMVGRNLTAEEKSEFGHAVIGYDAVAVIVNIHNPVQSITRGEIRNLYTRKVTQWGESFEGNPEVLLISKRIYRGTLAVFEAYSGLRSPFHPDKSTEPSNLISPLAWEAGANLDTILWVGGLRGAIGFVSAIEAELSVFHGMPIRLLKVDGFLPSQTNVSRGQYPLNRELYLVYRPDNKMAGDFVRFMLTSCGQKAVLDTGFVPFLRENMTKEVAP